MEIERSAAFERCQCVAASKNLVVEAVTGEIWIARLRVDDKAVGSRGYEEERTPVETIVVAYGDERSWRRGSEVIELDRSASVHAISR